MDVQNEKRGVEAGRQPGESVIAEPLAIVGIGCRLPGQVGDAKSFWELLCDGRSGVVEVPADRWSNERFYHPDPECLDSLISKWGGFVEGLDQFDARFWGTSPREALRMDPQQRWLLQTAWEAIEDSGTPPSKLRGREVGVFVGIAGNDFGGIQLPYHEIVDAYSNSGSTFSIASNRISYMLDLTGPSLSVDTACSSSLVAVWLACESIWSGRCSAALAGGVNALIAPHASIGFSRASMLSRSGQCYAFDARANGYVRGEGAGVVYLKRLNDAQRDGDRIYSVIRGAAVNQDGHTSSMTVPGIEGQSAMLRKAYDVARVDPRRVVYVEAHGTGTPVGDPIELTALGRVLGGGRDPGSAIVVGSVKTNIGHLEAGSGIAGLIKAALVLHHGEIPPNLNFEQANPNIPFETLGLRVAKKAEPLPRQANELPVVGVNSFGFGGTNAHVVLEAAPAAFVPELVSAKQVNRPVLLPISARDDEALRKYAAAYQDYLADETMDPRELATAAGRRKEHHERRLVIRGRDRQELRRRLRAWVSGMEQVRGVSQGRANKQLGDLTFVYTGQGAQWWGMGQQLQRCEPVFRRCLEEIDALLTPLAGWSLLSDMNRGQAESQIDRTDIAQPAIFALQVALTKLWAHWGIRPTRMVGHSVGEVAAACCAGVYDLADAVRVIYHRSRLQHLTGGRGSMFAVGISADEAWAAIGHRHAQVQVAVINNPNLVTLSGDRQPLEELAARFQVENRFLRWLPIDYAFHTHQMEPIREELLESLRDLQPRLATVPLISTVTAEELAGSEMDATYWWRNVREPVLFGPAILQLLKRYPTSFLELGPHPALASSLRDCGEAAGKHPHVFHSLKREVDEQEEILGNLAQLHLAGAELDWLAINQGRGVPMDLPSYPWSNESFWLETDASRRARLQTPEHPLLGLRSADAIPTWTVELDLHRLPFLADHRLWDCVVFPGASYVEIGLALARLLFPGEQRAVDGLSFHKALFVLRDDPPCLQITWQPTERTFSIHSRPRSRKEWELNASGQLLGATRLQPPRLDISSVVAKLNEELSSEQIRADLAGAGFQFGPNFQLVAGARRGKGEAIAELRLTTAVADGVGEFGLHPAILDACFQLAALLRVKRERAEENFLLPHSLRRLHLFRENVIGSLTAWGRLVLDEPTAMEANLWLTDSTGECVAEIMGFRSELAPQALSGGEGRASLHYRTTWHPRRLPGATAGSVCVFPECAALVEAATTIRNEHYVNGGLEQYTREVVPHLNGLAADFIQQAYVDLGWRPILGEEFTLEQHMVQLGIAERHRRLVAAQLRLLSAEGRLQAADSGGAWRAAQPLRQIDIQSLLKRLRAAGSAEELDLLEHCGSNLAAVLSGDLDPVQLLFPAEGSSLLERFYLRSADFPSNHAMIAEVMRQSVAALPPERVVRILEVGAGTASLTRQILPLLPADRTEYLFTDIGAAFLATAKTNLAKFPFVHYQTFDLEQEPERQGIAPHSCDIVVASNVLHATSVLEQTLRHLKHCLAPGGLLLFLETMNRIAYAETMVFGMLDGWWKYKDESLRTESPLLSQADWLDLLRSSGFEQADSFLSVPDPSDLLQAVFLARTGASPVEQRQQTTAPLAGRTFQLFPDRSGVAKLLAEQLESAGANVILASAGLVCTESTAVGGGPLAETQNECRSADEPSPTVPPDTEVIVVSGLDLPVATGALSTEQLAQAQSLGCLGLLNLLRLRNGPQRIWVLLRNVFVAVEGDRGEGLAGAPIVGLGRVVGNEQFPRQVRIVDWGAEQPAAAAEMFLRELVANTSDREVCYRGGQRWVPLLERAEPVKLPLRKVRAVGDEGVLVPFRLESRGTGILNNLEWRETSRHRPQSHELEVQVLAGGINFRDVMKALGTYPGHPVDLHWFGDDFSGVVTAVGADVTGIRVGDRVAGMAPYAFQSHVLVDARLVFPVPEFMSHEEAATLPTVFLTAHYALRQLARMRRGESILIHGGTGGVGQAAIQIAKQLGLEVFATAGSEEKRQLLREQGVQHVLNSRNLEFAREVREITRGRGVDAVLNSFAGDFIPRSLEVLAPYGRFLEIGKIDVYGNSRIGLYQLKDNISYFVIDLGQYVQLRQAQAGELFVELAAEIRAGRYRPLPYHVFPASHCVEAFRWMAQGKHIGKNVLAFDDPDLRVARSSQPQERFRSNGTYLISGGAGGFSLEIARTMVANGARSLVLLSRSGPRDATALETIETLRRDGANVVEARGDVTRWADVETIVQRITRDLPPLVGIVHGAMVLDDEFLSELTPTRFRSVLDVKMLGAWNLHLATRDCPLEDFICFSSFSAIIGAPKQASYNAGNYFLDALARYRRAHGKPALTINWGALRGAGFVERNQRTAEYLDRIGLHSLALEEAICCFRETILLDEAQLGIARANWSVLPTLCPTMNLDSRFRRVIEESRQQGQGGSLNTRLRAATPQHRLGLMTAFIAEQIAGVFGISPEKVELETPLNQMGLDSLMAIELKNRLERETNVTLPMNEILNGPTLTQLASSILTLLERNSSERPAADEIQPVASEIVAPVENSDVLDRIDNLSEAEIDRMLSELESTEEAGFAET